MSALSELRRLPQNKAEMESMLQTLINELDGASDYQKAEAITYLNLISKLFEDLKKVCFIKETMIKLANEKVEINGFRFEIHSGARYDYKHDHEWQKLNKQLKAREELMKTALTTEAIIYDSEGVEVPRAIKNTSESFKLTAKK